MAWWLTVYCRKSVESLTAAQLRAGITGEDRSAFAGVDYFTLAEDYGVPEEQVGPALKALTLEPVPRGFALHYRTPNEGATPPPIHIEVWRGTARVAEELEETDGRAPSARAKERLTGVKEVIGIELAPSMLSDMGVVFAYELARYLAQKADGVIVDDDGRWQAVDDGGFAPL